MSLEAMARAKQISMASGLCRRRWVVEQTLSWLHLFRPLRVRFDRRTDKHEASLALADAIISWKQLEHNYFGAI